MGDKQRQTQTKNFNAIKGALFDLITCRSFQGTARLVPIRGVGDAHTNTNIVSRDHNWPTCESRTRLLKHKAIEGPYVETDFRSLD